uniref:Uncharacterized protein n=1 Tax=Rhinolophus ferrumequinum TaxID=59479 RepID=A0A671DUX9_RHIFE
MIQWLSHSKIRYRENIAGLMDKCFPEINKPDEVAKYMETVKSLDYVEKPRYQSLRDIILQGLKSIGCKDDGKLELGVVENGGLKAKTVSKKRKKEIEESTESSVEDMEWSDAQTETTIQTVHKPEKGSRSKSNAVNHGRIFLRVYKMTKFLLLRKCKT